MPVAPGLTFGSAVQSCPQAPQLVGSELKLTHFVPHRLGFGETQLDEQAYVDPDPEQSAVGTVQVLPQLPQLSEVLRLVSQPSSARVEQCPYPARQAAGGTLQTPDLQVIPVAPAATFGRAVQSWPQPPQFSGSDARSTQLLPHAFGVAVGQVATHCGPPAPAAHFGAAPVHFCVQPPQVSASSSDASQPSSARDEQCPKLARQADGGT